MLNSVQPKLPMRNKPATLKFYIEMLCFKIWGVTEYDDYLMLQKDKVEIHFFKFEALNPLENYGMIYIRTDNIKKLYQQLLDANVPIHPNGPLETKPWGQKEFSLLDPDHNLLTFGEHIAF